MMFPFAVPVMEATAVYRVPDGWYTQYRLSQAECLFLLYLSAGGILLWIAFASVLQQGSASQRNRI